MLFSTSIQPAIFWRIFFVSFSLGLLFDFGGLITFFCNKNKIVQNIMDFFAMIISLFVFSVIVMKYNYGEFRLFCFLSFFLSLAIERMTLGYLIAKLNNWWYNTFNRFKTKINHLLREKVHAKNTNNQE